MNLHHSNNLDDCLRDRGRRGWKTVVRFDVVSDLLRGHGKGPETHWTLSYAVSALSEADIQEAVRLSKTVGS